MRASYRHVIAFVAVMLCVSASCLMRYEKPAGAFYPLAVGNIWRYDNTFEAVFIVGDDSTSRLQRVISEDELTGVESWMAHDYFVVRNRIIAVNYSDTILAASLLRQNESGLYRNERENLKGEVSATHVDRWRGEWDEDTPLSAVEVRRAHELREHRYRHRQIARAMGVFARGASDPLPGETTVLRYPLQEGQQWQVSTTGPVVIATVEGFDTLTTPAGNFGAFRIEFSSATIRENDFARVWYGSCGLIRFVVHLETRAMDPETGQMALIVTERIRALTDVMLVESHRCETIGSAAVLEPLH